MFGNFVLWENIELRREGEDSILTICEIRSGGLRVCWVDEWRRGRTREGCILAPLTVIGGSGQRLCPLPIFLLKSQQARPSGCGFSLSNPREGRQLPSERDANGGIKEKLKVIVVIY